MFGYRSLKYPDPKAPDYWAHTQVWWDNWAHNFAVSLIIWPGLAALVVLMVAILSGGL